MLHNWGDQTKLQNLPVTNKEQQRKLDEWKAENPGKSLRSGAIDRFYNYFLITFESTRATVLEAVTLKHFSYYIIQTMKY